MSELQEYQKRYIDLALKAKILSFDGAPYTLKSGRLSPYFFNAGLFNTGALIDAVASCYAAAIVQSGIDFDVLFGPAYKGIPLAATTAMALSRDFGIDKGFAFNRKEAKTHGEGGSLVGAPLRGKVLVIDDVMTAGTAMGEAVSIIEAASTASPQNPAELAGIVIALDRQERATELDPRSTVSMVTERYHVPVTAVVTLEQILTYLRAAGGFEKQIEGMQAYRAKYGAN